MSSQDFDAFYQDIYGTRWASLRQSLLEPTRPIAWKNPFSNSFNNLEKEYHLDAASVLAAQMLGVQPGERILDLCAAPGGKTLQLASQIAESGFLVANERSAARRNRLKTVINGYLPDSLRERIQITGHDGTRWGLFEKEIYDRILVDAPCSSERHVIQSPKHLNLWSRAKGKQLVVRQWALLAAAFDSLKPGGTLVYCTCSINPAENDGVIQRLLKKRDRVTLVPLSVEEMTMGEPSALGWLILPDLFQAGPLYLSKIQKALATDGDAANP